MLARLSSQGRVAVGAILGAAIATLFGFGVSAGSTSFGDHPEKIVPSVAPTNPPEPGSSVASQTPDASPASNPVVVANLSSIAKTTPASSDSTAARQPATAVHPVPRTTDPVHPTSSANVPASTTNASPTSTSHGHTSPPPTPTDTTDPCWLALC